MSNAAGGTPRRKKGRPRRVVEQEATKVDKAGRVKQQRQTRGSGRGATATSTRWQGGQEQVQHTERGQDGTRAVRTGERTQRHTVKKGHQPKSATRRANTPAKPRYQGKRRREHRQGANQDEGAPNSEDKQDHWNRGHYGDSREYNA